MSKKVGIFLEKFKIYGMAKKIELEKESIELLLGLRLTQGPQLPR